MLRLVHEAGLAGRGDYYEFGIYRGYTFWYAQKTMTDLGEQRMHFIGVDSFEGLPTVRGVDAYKGTSQRTNTALASSPSGGCWTPTGSTGTARC